MRKDKQNEENDDLGVHQLMSSRKNVLKKLFAENKVDPFRQNFINKIQRTNRLTQPFQFLQNAMYKKQWRKIDITDTAPVFILGHWRSGTTHLHYLLSKDPQFGYLTNYQNFCFTYSLVGSSPLKFFINLGFPDTRPQDNVKVNASDPAEEEQPFSNFSVHCGLHSFFFPKNISYFNKYNLFKGISDAEFSAWKSDYKELLQIIAYANKGRHNLILKNPHNTGRLKVLSEMFPKAKFIFIHRHPEEIFVSTRHLYDKIVKSQFFQNFSDDEINEQILYCYETIMQKYIDDRNQVDPSRIFELSYEELSNQPSECVQNIYQHLNIENFEAAKPHFSHYLESTSKYKKNAFNPIPEDIKNQIMKRWKFAYDEWGYVEPLIK